MQYEKVPRKTPSVHCVTRSLEKPTMMRGENCIDARLLLTISSSVADQTRTHKEEQTVPPSCSIQRTGSAKGIETLQPYKRPCQPISRLQGQACGVCREKNLDQWLQPPALGGDAVRVPQLDRRLEARDLRIGELEVLRRDGERGIPHYTLLSSDHLALQFECLLLIGVQGDLVLHRPDRANRPHVCPLRAQERMQVQTLGVVQRQLHS